MSLTVAMGLCAVLVSLQAADDDEGGMSFEAESVQEVETNAPPAEAPPPEPTEDIWGAEGGSGEPHKVDLEAPEQAFKDQEAKKQADAQASQAGVESAAEVGGLGLAAGLALDAYVTQGRTFGVDVAEDSSEGLHGINYAPYLSLSYAPPLPPDWRVVALVAGVGYTPFFGTGYASFSQYAVQDGAYQLQTTRYRYDWTVHMVPLDLGLRAWLPLPRLGLMFPLRLEAGAGFAGGLAIALSTLTLDGEDEPISRDVGSVDFGLGYYLEAGASFPLPPGFGSVFAAYRYSAVRLDFHQPGFNPAWGDLGGHHLVVGYRFEI